MKSHPIRAFGRCRWGLTFLACLPAVEMLSQNGSGQDARIEKIQTWRNLGPGGGGAFYDAAWHPTVPNRVMAASDVGGPVISDDAGNAWRSAAQIVADQSWLEQVGIYAVERIHYAHGDPDLVFAATFGGLFRSANGGAQWRKVIDPPTDVDEPTRYGAVVVDPEDSSQVWAASGGRYFYNPLLTGGEEQYVAPEGFFWWSKTGGLDFTRLEDTGLPDSFAATDLWIDPASPPDARRIVMASWDGIFVSDDSGQSFVSANEGLPKRFVRDLDGGRLPNGESLIYLTLQAAGTNENNFTGGVFLSEDGGDSWEPITANLPVYDEEIDDILFDWSIAVHPTDARIAYVLLGNNDSLINGVYRTGDAGKSWTHLTEDWEAPGFTTGYLDLQPGHGGTFLSLSPANPDHLLLGNFFELIRSVDGGQTWQESYSASVPGSFGATWRSRGAENTFVYDVVFNPFDPGHMWFGFEDVLLWESRDNGRTLTRIANPKDEEFWKATDAAWQLLPDSDREGHLYLAASSPSAGKFVDLGGLFFSSDGGANWEDISGELPEFRPEIALGPPPKGKNFPALYAAIANRGFYRSFDHGISWNESNSGLGEERINAWKLTLDQTAPNVLYLGMNTDDEENPGDGGLYRTADGGQSWTRLPAFPVKEVFDLKTSAGRVFASGASEISDDATGGLFASSDGGQSWQQLLNQPFIHAFTWDPANRDTLYAVSSVAANLAQPEGIEPGIYQSQDAGETWHRIDVGLSHYQLTSITVDPQDSNTLYVGTLGQGVLVGEFESMTTQTHLQLQVVDFNPLTGVTLRILGEAGVEITVQTSPDLKSWTNWTHATLSANGIELLDSQATDESSRFYRVLAP